jgi:hypothetical protein
MMSLRADEERLGSTIFKNRERRSLIFMLISEMEDGAFSGGKIEGFLAVNYYRSFFYSFRSTYRRCTQNRVTL